MVTNHWRDGRVVDYNGLENRRAERHRGFESLSLRKQGCKSASYAIYTLYYTQEFKSNKKNYTQAIILGMTFGIGEFIRFYNDETTSSLASLAERHCGDCL